MIETYDHGGIVEHARAYVASNFTPREQGSRVLSVTLFIFAALAIATTAGRVDPPVAIFGAGLTAAVAGFVMLVGWGASSGHSGVCLCTAAEIEKRGQEVDARFEELREDLRIGREGATALLADILTRLNDVETSSLEVVEAVRDGIHDELQRRRSRN